MAKKNKFSSLGEGVIRAGERDVLVRFDNRALAQAEQQMGKSVLGVARGFADSSTGSGITELAHLLRAGMQAARKRNKGRPVTMSDAYRVMDEAGFSEVTTVVMRALSDVLGYDPAEDSEESEDFDDDELDPNE